MDVFQTKQPRANRGRRGFSAPEWIVAVLIGGVLIATAFPGFILDDSQSRTSNDRETLRVLRQAIEIYRARVGDLPTESSDAFVDAIQPFLRDPFPAPTVPENRSGEVFFESGYPTGEHVAEKDGLSPGWVYNLQTHQFRINSSGPEGTW